MCCGHIGMAPAAFYDLTYAEMALILEGYTERVKAKRRDLAWAVSYLLQPHLKEGATLTPAQLLGEPEPRGRKKKANDGWLTPGDAAVELERIQRDIKVEVVNG